MGVVVVHHKNQAAKILTGAKPADKTGMIESPTDTGGAIGVGFEVTAGIHCYMLDCACTPIWQSVQVVDGIVTDVYFT